MRSRMSYVRQIIIPFCKFISTEDESSYPRVDYMLFSSSILQQGGVAAWKRNSNNVNQSGTPNPQSATFHKFIHGRMGFPFAHHPQAIVGFNWIICSEAMVKFSYSGTAEEQESSQYIRLELYDWAGDNAGNYKEGEDNALGDSHQEQSISWGVLHTLESGFQKSYPHHHHHPLNITDLHMQDQL